MPRQPQADFGGNRYRGSATSRQANAIKARSKRNQTEGKRQELQRKQDVQNRELERGYQLENLQLRAQQGVDADSLRLQLQVEQDALNNKQLLDQGLLASEGETKEAILQNKASLDQYKTDQRFRRAELKQTIQSNNARANQVKIQAFQTTVSGLLSFAGSYIDYRVEKQNQAKQEKKLLASRAYISGRSPKDFAVLEQDQIDTDRSFATEQAIRNSTNNPLDQAKLRQQNADNALARVRRKTSTIDYGLSYEGKQRQLINTPGVINTPLGAIDVLNPTSYQQIDEIIRFNRQKIYDSVNLLGLDAPEAVRSLRGQIESAENSIKSQLYQRFFTRQNTDRKYATKVKIASQITSGDYSFQSIFDTGSEDLTNYGFSLGESSKAVVLDMVNFLENSKRLDDLQSLYGLYQGDVSFAILYGEEISTAIDNVTSGIESKKTLVAKQINEQLLEKLRPIDDPLERIELIESTAEELTKLGLDKDARQLLESIPGLKKGTSALIGDANILSRIETGEIRTEAELDREVALGSLTEEGRRKGVAALDILDLGKMPDDLRLKITIRGQQSKASTDFLTAIGYKKNPDGSITVDNVLDSPVNLTPGEAKQIEAKLDREILELANQTLQQLPSDATNADKQKALKETGTKYYKETLLDKASGLYIGDFKEQIQEGRGAFGSKDYSFQQRNRFKQYIKSDEFSSIQSSLLSRNVDAARGISPIDWSSVINKTEGQREGPVTSLTMQNYNPLRGDTLLSKDELLEVSKDWKNGIISPKLLELSTRFRKSPLSIINDAIRSPLTPQNVPTFTLNSLSETPLGSGNEPISALEGARMLVQAGFPPKGAAWLSGNIQQESSWDGQQDRWDDVGADAAGIVSWRASRIDQIEAIGGKRMEEMTNAEQVQAMITEMKQNYPEVYKTFTNPYATDRSLKKASEEYWVYGEEGDRYRVARQVEAQMRAKIPDTSTGSRSYAGALTYKNNQSAYKAVGDFLLKDLSFKVAEHDEFGGVGKHSKNSFHYYNEAFDITNWEGGNAPGAYEASIAKTQRLKEVIRSLDLFKEVIGPGDGPDLDPYGQHKTHLHLGGLLRPMNQDDMNIIRSSMK